MPRDANGNYTKPNPPVSAGETIQSAYENSNTDDQATEFTDSLSRTGKGAMLAALKLADLGLVFENESNSGLRRHASGDIRFDVLAGSGLILGENTANGIRLGKIDKDGSLAALIAAIGSTPTTLRLWPEVWPVTANLTIPENVRLVFDGAVLQVSTGVELTLVNPPIASPDDQIFDGEGIVRIQKSNGRTLEWRGFVRNSFDAGVLSGNDTAIARTIADMEENERILLGGGGYHYSKTMDFGTKNVSIIGSGMRVTRLRYRATDGTDAIAMTASGIPRSPHLVDFELRGVGATGHGLKFNNFGRGFALERILVRDFRAVGKWGIHMEDCLGGHMDLLYVWNCKNGIVLTGDSDNVTMNNCSVYGFDDVGIQLLENAGGNGPINVLMNCPFIYNGTANNEMTPNQGVAIDLNGARRTTLINPWMEFTKTSLSLKRDGSVVNSDTVVIGGQWITSPGVVDPVGLSVVSSTKLTMVGSRITGDIELGSGSEANLFLGTSRPTTDNSGSLGEILVDATNNRLDIYGQDDVVSVNNDSVVNVSLKKTTGVVQVTNTNPSNEGVSSASFSYRSRSVYRCYKQSGGDNFDASTTALTGTTGAAGNITVSVNSDDVLQIENRTGGTLSFRVAQG